eukprot:1208751-Pleurochrysis_carterae.AAC.2
MKNNVAGEHIGSDHRAHLDNPPDTSPETSARIEATMSGASSFQLVKKKVCGSGVSEEIKLSPASRWARSCGCRAAIIMAPRHACDRTSEFLVHIGARAACVTSAKTVWLARGRGNSETGDAATAGCHALKKTRSGTVGYKFNKKIVADGALLMNLFLSGLRAETEKFRPKGLRLTEESKRVGFWGAAATAGPTCLLPVELTPECARGFHRQTLHRTLTSVNNAVLARH